MDTANAVAEFKAMSCELPEWMTEHDMEMLAYVVKKLKCHGCVIESVEAGVSRLVYSDEWKPPVIHERDAYIVSAKTGHTRYRVQWSVIEGCWADVEVLVDVYEVVDGLVTAGPEVKGLVEEWLTEWELAAHK